MNDSSQQTITAELEEWATWEGTTFTFDLGGRIIVGSIIDVNDEWIALDPFARIRIDAIRAIT